MIPYIANPQRTCLSCYWFQFPSDTDYEEAKAANRLPPLRNRLCRYDGALTIRAQQCQMWRNCYTRWERLKMRLGFLRVRRRSIVR
jgi:hypothetical protein